MTHPNKQGFWEWAYGDLLSNTNRGVLAEYIVATALGIDDTKRVEWNQYDLKIGDVKVEVKSAAYVQTWEQTRLSTITFGIRPAKGWDSSTNISATIAQRSADVYVFCLLGREELKRIDPLDVEQWTFYVLSTRELNRKVPERQKTIGLAPLKALGVQPCTYDELTAAIHKAAADNRGS